MDDDHALAMILRPIRSLLAFGLGLAPIAPVLAQSDSLQQELSILADRFFLRFPQGARNESRSVDIMAAPPGEQKETRIVLDSADERIVFFAQELNMRGTADLTGAWARMIERPGHNEFSVSELDARSPWRGLSYSPLKADSSAEAILLRGWVMEGRDGLLLSIAAYANPAAYKRSARYLSLVDRIFGSFRPGTRVVDLSAREVTFLLSEGESVLVLDLPEGHVVLQDGAYDFIVHRIMHVPELGAQKGAMLTIYQGHHPSLFLRGHGRDESTVERTPGTLFGKRMEWLTVHDEQERIHLLEQIVPIDDHLVVHIAADGNDAAEVAALIGLAQSMSLKP